MKHFVHSFQVKSSLSAVAEFHRSSIALRKLTPPPVIVQFHRLEPISEGSTAEFTMWFGPIPVRWTARHSQVNLPYGFIDEQIDGPFSQWKHRHGFNPIGENTTEVIDEIQAELGKHPFWGLVGWAMWITLPLLFAYRAWVTRRSIEMAVR